MQTATSTARIIFWRTFGWALGCLGTIDACSKKDGDNHDDEGSSGTTYVVCQDIELLESPVACIDLQVEQVEESADYCEEESLEIQEQNACCDNIKKVPPILEPVQVCSSEISSVSFIIN